MRLGPLRWLIATSKAPLRCCIRHFVHPPPTGEPCRTSSTSSSCCTSPCVPWPGGCAGPSSEWPASSGWSSGCGPVCGPPASSLTSSSTRIGPGWPQARCGCASPSSLPRSFRASASTSPNASIAHSTRWGWATWTVSAAQCSTSSQPHLSSRWRRQPSPPSCRRHGPRPSTSHPSSPRPIASSRMRSTRPLPGWSAELLTPSRRSSPTKLPACPHRLPTTRPSLLLECGAQLNPSSRCGRGHHGVIGPPRAPDG